MSCRVPCVVIVAVLLGQVGGGPTLDLHPAMADQELFWGADQYDFSILLPASGLECVWHFAHHGERFYLTFMVSKRCSWSDYGCYGVFLNYRGKILRL